MAITVISNLIFLIISILLTAAIFPARRTWSATLTAFSTRRAAFLSLFFIRLGFRKQVLKHFSFY